MIRAALTALLVLAIALSVDFSETDLRFGPDAPLWLAAAVGWVLAARVLLVVRWQVLLRALDCRVRSWRLGMMVFASHALGLLLPGSIGMDVARGVLLRLDGPEASGPVVVSSIVLDRAAATLGTALVGLVAAVLLGRWGLAAGVLCVILAGVIGTLLLVSSDSWARAVLEHVLPRRVSSKLIGKLESMLALLSTPGMLWRGLAPAVVLGAFVTVARAMLFLSLYHALDAHVPVILTLLVLSLTLIAMMVPVTLGGFGVRELSLIAGFESIGIAAGISVSVGVLAFAMQTVLSLPFAIWAMLAIGGKRGREASGGA